MMAFSVGTILLASYGIYNQGVQEMYEYVIKNAITLDAARNIIRYGKHIESYVRDEPGLRSGFQFRLSKSRKIIKMNKHPGRLRIRLSITDGIGKGAIKTTASLK